MGKKYKNRREFLDTLLNRNASVAEAEVLDSPGVPIKEAPPGPDALFERFSRKQLSGGRVYSEQPEPDQTGSNAARATTVSSTLTPYGGTWGDAEVMHLLRRTGFGVRQTDVATLKALGVSSAVDAVLNVTTSVTNPSATPLNYYNNISGATDSSGVNFGASWTGTNMTFAATSNDSTVDAYRQYSLQAWLWGTWINHDLTIREKMVQFWFHFIPIDFSDVRNTVTNGATICNDYVSLLRANATGNFFTLMKAIAKSPAMLVYLGGQYSTASTPNENFARELMELFTLGKVPTQNYDEFDIKAAAKVFSGWRVTSTTTPAGNPFVQAYPFTVAFNATYHNTSNKVFSSNFGTTTITGLTGSSGATEFDTFFNMLFTQQASTIAKYICRRLYRYFVYYDIDSTIEANIINGLANTLLATTTTSNPWDMMPVLKQLFKSQHFYDMANRGVMIKSPVDLLTGVLRDFSVNTTAATGTNQVYNQYLIWKYLNDYCNNYLEQSAGLVPNVSGYKAYYQSPSFYQNWINTNTVQRRSSILTSLMSTNGISVGGIQLKIDVMAYMNNFSSTVQSDPDLLTAAIVERLLTVDPGQTLRDQLKTQNLLQNQTTNAYWTTAWANYVGSPTNSSYLSIVKTRLSNLISAILQMAEYQLM